MRAGVILGSYNYPRLIETQIKLIRECNGADTPILVSDDCSPGCMDLPDYDSQFTTLLKIVEDNNVALWCSPDRLGHVGGDLACYYLGIQWGKMHGLDVVCKLSQRLLIDIPCWLDESAEKLLASGFATGCQSCFEGPHRLPLRTEAILFDVNKWHRQDVLLHMRPRPTQRIAAESVVMQAMQMIEPDFHRWDLFQERRTVRDPGIVWHCSAPREEYQKIADRYGITLDESFTVAGWGHTPNYA